MLALQGKLPSFFKFNAEFDSFMSGRLDLEFKINAVAFASASWFAMSYSVYMFWTVSYTSGGP
jgi:hypothetical protein